MSNAPSHGGTATSWGASKSAKRYDEGKIRRIINEGLAACRGGYPHIHLKKPLRVSGNHIAFTVQTDNNDDMNASLDTLEELSIPERILLVEDLWDSIAKDSDSMPVADWQKVELARRKAAFIHHPQSAMTWDVVKLSVLGHND